MVQLQGHCFHHFRLVVDYLQVQRFHTPGVFLAKFEASTVLFSEKDPCFGVVEDNQDAEGYSYAPNKSCGFQRSSKNDADELENCVYRRKRVLPDVLWKPSGLVLHILSRDKYDSNNKNLGVSGHLFSPSALFQGGRPLEIPSVVRGPRPS